MVLRDPHSGNFCRKNACRDGEPTPARRDRLWSYAWTVRKRANPMDIAALRGQLRRAWGIWPACGLSDELVIRQVADWMSTGVLHLHGRPAAENGQAKPEKESAPGGGGGGGAKSVPFPISERRPRASAAPAPAPAPEPSTFGDLDTAAQAAVLVAAAADGKPFCPE